MKVVKVLWVSCNSNKDWTVAEDIEVEPMCIDSFGVVVKDTDEFLAIAQNYSDDPEQYSNITTIPKSCIKEVIAIHEDNVCEKEQESADKVEPKFNVGDWIIANDDSSIHIDYTCCKITKVENGNYTIESIYGYKGYNTFETFEKDYHLWTIQDAKDGDVIVGGEQLFLFKRMNSSNSFYAHFVYHFIGYDSLSVYDCSYSIDNIYPATKKQRDVLFQKMRKAGYEWDAEKKELKKIEQKPADKVKPKFKVGDIIRHKKHGFTCKIIAIDTEYRLSECCGTHLPFDWQDAYELVEQKPAEWEPQTGDTFRKKGTTSPTYHLCDKRVDGITFGFVEIREVGISGGEITIFSLKRDYELVERSKSIDDVVEEEFNKDLQTKVNEWSEEDERAVGIIKTALEHPYDMEGKWDRKFALDWIKFLKYRVQPQQQWAPSDEQMKALDNFIFAKYPNIKKHGKAVKSLYLDLKKLRKE